MLFSYTHESVRLTGRWDTSSPSFAQTTATGSYVEFAFIGPSATALFDIPADYSPSVHLWIELDGAAQIEVPLDRYIRINARNNGRHVCRIIYKSGYEYDHRWNHPLQTRVAFIGFDAEQAGEMGPDGRKIIEFVGDSITQGVLVDEGNYEASGGALCPRSRQCYADDVCGTYAWYTAVALGLRAIFMGYGAVGATRAGSGEVPPAPEAYPYNFQGSPITRPTPDYVLVNHGANDRGASEEVYCEKYSELLDRIRESAPSAKIIALSAFCGGHHHALGRLIERYNEQNGTDIRFIDSTGWVPVEPLHPIRADHKKISEHLVPLLKEYMSL